MLQHNRVMAATRPSDLKLTNRMQILELFKTGGVYSVADLAREVGISRQTVMKSIQFFLEKGIIVSDGKAESTNQGGKRAELFSLSPKRYLFNVLVCPDCVYVSLFSFHCEVVDDVTLDDVGGMGVEALVAKAGEMCRSLIRDCGVPMENVYGACISTPGIVARETNRLRFNSFFPDWDKDIPVAEMLARELGGGVPVVLENVSKVCGRAFLRSRSHSESRGATVFSAWGGISASLIAHGHILNGDDSLIGEIGHMTLVPDDPETCGCGGHGCFERQVSRERIQRFIARRLGAYPESVLAGMPLDAIAIRDVFDASRRGDALAREVSAYAARFFGQALHNLTLAFNPGWVVLQGDYAGADEHFREAMYEELRRFRYYDRAGANSPFELQTDTRSIQELTTLGAYTLLIDQLFSDETTYS